MRFLFSKIHFYFKVNGQESGRWTEVKVQKRLHCLVVYQSVRDDFSTSASNFVTVWKTWHSSSGIVCRLKPNLWNVWMSKTQIEYVTKEVFFLPFIMFEPLIRIMRMFLECFFAKCSLFNMFADRNINWLNIDSFLELVNLLINKYLNKI